MIFLDLRVLTFKSGGCKGGGTRQNSEGSLGMRLIYSTVLILRLQENYLISKLCFLQLTVICNACLNCKTVDINCVNVCKSTSTAWHVAGIQ